MRVRMIIAVLLALGAVPALWAATRPEGREGPGKLVTNEYAHWNPSKNAPRSSTWDVTSGSLFTRDGVYWTGPPDAGTPDATSSNATGSSVFRMNTRRDDYLDAHVVLDVRTLRLVHGSARAPTRDTDGVHVMLRRQDETELYVVSVNRRDEQLVVKKKVSGGPVNGGKYFTLAKTEHPYDFGTWQRFDIRISGTSPVTITVAQDGRQLLQAVDDGSHGPPITHPGSLGLRGDNCEFEFKYRIR